MKKIWIVLLHACFWAVDILVLSQIFVFDETRNVIIRNGNAIVSTKHSDLFNYILVGILFKIAFSYIIIFAIYPQYEKGRKSKAIFGLVGLLLLFFIAEEGLFILSELNRLIFRTGSLPALLKINLFLYTLHLIYILSFLAIRQWVRNERQKRLMLEEKYKLELEFLKVQINPHFLFNTLNNLFSLTQKNENEEVGQAIIKLSDFIRYVIYINPEKKTILPAEITYLETYIELQKLKFSNDDHFLINLKTVGNVNNFSIYPLLLTPFVENAFKHGFKEGDKMYINIEINITDKKFIYSVSNTLYDTVDNLDTLKKGIGIPNLKRRLELLYPFSHELSAVKTGNTYQATLTLFL